jgi:hypothetical protein
MFDGRRSITDGIGVGKVLCRMGISRVRSTILTVSLAAALAVGGCGGGASSSSGGGGEAGKDPAAILKDVKRDLAKVKSMHLSGTLPGKGKTTKLVADVFVSGSASLELTEGASSVRMLVLPTAVYLKGNDAYWRDAGGAAIAEKVGDRWVKAPAEAGKSLQPILDEFSPKKLASCIDVGLGTISTKGTETVDGQEVVVLQDAGDKPGTSPGLLYVTTDAPNLPVRVINKGATKPGGTVDKRCEGDEGDDDPAGGEISFSQFDEVPEIKAPSDALDLQDIAPQDDNSIA